jgi:hypothetical protein
MDDWETKWLDVMVSHGAKTPAKCESLEQQESDLA